MESSFQADMWRKNISRIANAVPGLTCARAQNGCYRRILAWPPPHPTPTPQEFMCHFGVGTYATGTSASEYFVISPPYFPYICGSIFFRCGSISCTFPCKPDFFFTPSNCSLFCCVLEHCVTLRSKDKTKNMWNMWKGIHSSFKPEQAHCHHRGEKPLIGPNLCQLWLQFDHNVSIEKARDGAHCIGPTQRPIRKTFFFLMLFPVYKR